MRASTCSYKILIAFWGDSEAELDIHKKNHCEEREKTGKAVPSPL